MIKVYSKIELSESIKTQILAVVNNRFNQRNKLSDLMFLIDESIISGIRIDHDSNILDLTLNNTLEKIIDILQ
jgi:F0F1-type ATP synthase delta subunit